MCDFSSQSFLRTVKRTVGSVLLRTRSQPIHSVMWTKGVVRFRQTGTSEELLRLLNSLSVREVVPQVQTAAALDRTEFVQVRVQQGNAPLHSLPRLVKSMFFGGWTGLVRDE